MITFVASWWYKLRSLFHAHGIKFKWKRVASIMTEARTQTVDDAVFWSGEDKTTLDLRRMPHNYEVFNS